MSEPSRFLMQVVGDIEQGDLWRIAKVEGDYATFERVQAEPGQYRKRGDGLWPPLPDTRPVSDEEAREIAERMDAALDAGGEFIRTQAPFLPPDDVGPKLQEALSSGWAKPVTSPFADLDCEPQLAAAQERQQARDRITAETVAGMVAWGGATGALLDGDG